MLETGPHLVKLTSLFIIFISKPWKQEPLSTRELRFPPALWFDLLDILNRGCEAKAKHTLRKTITNLKERSKVGFKNIRLEKLVDTRDLQLDEAG